jgi:meso-butanediol dehydrogenase / (S,S)-butanediol dehydrogenase / diacetyl reductase
MEREETELLRNRIAFVTGAGSGIGAACARQLASEGARVWLADLREDAAQAVAESIRTAGGSASAVGADVGSDESIDAAFDVFEGTESALDILVNCAGVLRVRRFDEFTPDDWATAMRVNVTGSYLTLRRALPLLRAARAPSRVINVASAAAKRPGPYTAPYNASKAAILSLTRTAAIALAPQVLVNAVSPGVIDTPMWQGMDKELADVGAGPAASFEGRVAALPLKRAGTVEDVAAVVSFVAGPGGQYLVGEEINVNGGLTTV